MVCELLCRPSIVVDCEQIGAAWLLVLLRVPLAVDWDGWAADLVILRP